jgi:hypothetical protein
MSNSDITCPESDLTIRGYLTRIFAVSRLALWPQSLVYLGYVKWNLAVFWPRNPLSGV